LDYADGGGGRSYACPSLCQNVGHTQTAKLAMTSFLSLKIKKVSCAISARQNCQLTPQYTFGMLPAMDYWT